MKKRYERSNIVISDLYLRYPYKYYDKDSSTVPFPYFPKDEITDHEYTLSFKQWSTIIKCYIKHVVSRLIKGEDFDIPQHLGTLGFRKAKRAKKKIDIQRTIKLYGEENKNLPRGEKKLAYLPYKDIFAKHSFYLNWMRLNKNFRFKWYWKFEFAKTNLVLFGKEMRRDISLQNRIQQK